MPRWFLSVLAVCLLWLAACAPSETNTPQVLRLGMVPFETGEELLRDIQPMIDVIEAGMGMEVIPTVAADYTGVVEAFKNQQLDVAFLSPAAYVLAAQEANVRVILKSHRDGSPNYYGAIIVRADSPIQTVADLKGKRFAFGDPLSTSGHIFARKLMLEAGLNPERDLEKFIYAGSHDATILSVLNQKVDAGASYADDLDGKSSAWQRFLDPRDHHKIRVLAYTEPIPSDNICVSAEFPEALTQKLFETITAFTESEAGHALVKKLYKLDGYVAATDADYAPIRAGFQAAGIDLKASLSQPAN
ncbi:MAG: phosphate/phosphite/phosphonate ABC transporter substrate-binding protein [Candidatus Sericytochromatia bacterium]|nr:phosphate/phosphite/phosphonate ABC transporter substrate-binding protein [Candidatus Sericytochromatia bacterium]